VRLLVDECLSPALVQVAHRAGYEATTVRDLGALGESDRRIVARALESDRAIVTNNAGDFVELCRRAALHPGLIVLPSVPRDAEIGLFARALAHIVAAAAERSLAPRDFILNRVVEVDESGHCEDQELPITT